MRSAGALEPAAGEARRPPASGDAPERGRPAAGGDAPSPRAGRVLARARALVLPLSGRRLVVALVLLVAASLVLRTTALHARYWIDEGLSVGIAGHPFLDIPGVLRQDGSPPLYYLLLHVWTAVFDVGEADTHVLSVLLALATIPVGFALGRALFGLRAGLATAVLFALNPFLTYYAQETRMYALVALLSLCVAGTFALAFALRRRAWLPAFAASLALLLYTHNWGLFLGAGAALAALVLWRLEAEEERRALGRDALLAFGAVAVAYLPWVPSLLFQTAHTAAPWSERPQVAELWNTLSTVLGGAAPAMAFALTGAAGVVAVLRAAGRPAGRGPATAQGRAVLALLVLLVAGVLLAWLASQPSPAWAARYLSAVLGPLLLLGGVGLARAGWLGLVGLALLTVFWLDPRTSQLEAKSNAHDAAVLARHLLEPGDLVVAGHPEYGPTMHLYLPPGLRWASTVGPVADPAVMDWRDAMDRLRAARPRPTSDAMVRSLREGQRLVFVKPIFRTSRWGAPWTRLVKRRALRWSRLLEVDTRLVRVLTVPRLDGGPLPRGVRIVVYERVPQGTGGNVRNG